MLTRPFFRVISCAALVLACSKQGEGERCDQNSGNLDCETGLICRGAEQLSNIEQGASLCCPPDGVAPTVNACRAGLPESEVLPPVVGDAGDGGT
jgi:hypothetical protein